MLPFVFLYTRNARMVAFPIIKLGSLLLKQVSKPLAKFIRERAISSPTFRHYVCMPPAQFYHWADVHIRMRILGLKRSAEIRPLNEEMAVELGAEMLGEFVIFTVAAGTIYMEYQRSSNKEKQKEEDKEQLVKDLQDNVSNLMTLADQQKNRIDQLEGRLKELDLRTQKLKR